MDETIGEWTEVAYTVYVLRDPRTKRVRYVGYTANKTSRKTDHTCTYYDGPTGNKPYTRWKKRLLRDGLRPVFEVAARLPEGRMAKQLERSLMAFYARESGPALLNLQSNPLWHHGWRGKYRWQGVCCPPHGMTRKQAEARRYDTWFWPGDDQLQRRIESNDRKQLRTA